MANPTAPTTMESVQAGTLRTTPRKSLKEFVPDRGLPLTEPKGETRLTDMSWTTELVDQTEKTAIDTFYYTTCNQGSLRFDMTDPESGATATYKWKSPPVAKLEAGIDEYRVSLDLVRIGE